MTASTVLIAYLWIALAYHIAGHGLFAFYRARKTAPMTHKDFTKDDVWFGRLRMYGIHGASLTFTHDRSGRALSIYKHSPNAHERGIVLVLRATDLNQDRLAALRAYCKRHQLSLETQKEDAGDETETIHVSCGNSTVDAHDLAVEIWTKIFHVRTKSAYTLKVSGLNFNNPKLGPLDWPVAISFVGLAVSTLLSIDAPPDWTASLGRANLNGSIASLLFFVAFFASAPLASFHQRPPHLLQSLLLRLYGYGRILFGLTLPIAVLLVWAGV
jgi:hypothetical protein